MTRLRANSINCNNCLAHNWTTPKNSDCDGLTKSAIAQTQQSKTKCELCAKSRDDVIKWNNFPRCWHFVRGIHQSPVDFPHKGQRRGALMFSLICG